MARTRVLIGQGPPILQAIVRDVIARAPDLELVGREAPRYQDGRANRGWLLKSLRRHRPDFLIVGHDEDGQRDLWREVLAGHPDLRILGISARGRDATLYELTSRRIAMGEASATGLLATIRAYRQIPRAQVARRGYRLRTRSAMTRLPFDAGGEGRRRMWRAEVTRTQAPMLLERGSPDPRQRAMFERRGPNVPPYSGSHGQGGSIAPSYPPDGPPARPTPTVPASLAELANALFVRFQQANVMSEFALIIRGLAETLNRMPAATFDDLVRDATRWAVVAMRATRKVAQEEPQKPGQTINQAQAALKKAWNDLKKVL